MSQEDPFYIIAEATAAQVGEGFLAALVRSMREVMDVNVAAVTRGIGEPPARARASLCWKKAGSSFPDEYELEGTPCEFVYLRGSVQSWQGSRLDLHASAAGE